MRKTKKKIISAYEKKVGVSVKDFRVSDNSIGVQTNIFLECFKNASDNSKGVSGEEFLEYLKNEIKNKMEKMRLQNQEVSAKDVKNLDEGISFLRDFVGNSKSVLSLEVLLLRINQELHFKKIENDVKLSNANINELKKIIMKYFENK